ncbi:MAG TPA: hypothetical protein VF582_01235 [Allosphingosinicella sp.]
MAIVVWNPKMTFASAPLRLPISSGRRRPLPTFARSRSGTAVRNKDSSTLGG